jgi:hypothetical protein
MADKYVKLDDIIETLEHEWGYEGMREDLYSLPTADVVPVVRCKDCKHCRKPKGKERYRYFEGVLLCESYEMSDDVCAVNPDDYCSYGERRCSDG